MKLISIILVGWMAIFPELIWIKEPQPGQIKKNIHFILDKSCSMQSSELTEAITSVINIAEQSVDELNIAITAFGADHKRWEGVEDEHTPKNWAALPSKSALEIANKWMGDVSINNGSTHLENPLMSSLSEKIPNLTIIIVSDMQFNGTHTTPDKIARLIKELQIKREEAGLDKATVGFYGIRASNNCVKSITEVIEKIDGFFCNSVIKKEEVVPELR